MDTNKGQYLSRTVVFATGPITEAQIPKLEVLKPLQAKCSIQQNGIMTMT
jgi:hypothetical protein